MNENSSSRLGYGPTYRRGRSSGLILERAETSPRYMHNGYFKSLKEVVHFYNTRDVIPKCKAGDSGEKVTCWPEAEDSTNLNKKQLGNLKLTDQEEDALVAFLKTLTDGYNVPSPRTAK